MHHPPNFLRFVHCSLLLLRFFLSFPALETVCVFANTLRLLSPIIVLLIKVQPLLSHFIIHLFNLYYLPYSLIWARHVYWENDLLFHHIFHPGTFQSTVTCFKCGNTTIAFDPFLDISLDIRPLLSPTIVTGHTFPIDTIDRTTIEMHTLSECLERFTHQERLTTEYKCSQCSTPNSNNHTASSSHAFSSSLPLKLTHMGATKQLSLKKLPLILALQLKRYDHRFTIQPSLTGKISSVISFPLDLDMTPYTVHGVEIRNTSQNQSQPKSFKNPSYLYTLFAVIVHCGTLQSGHYISFIRTSGRTNMWFRCDDDMVTRVEWREVEQCEAYMCFYVKKNFEYQKQEWTVVSLLPLPASLHPRQSSPVDLFFFHACGI